jgi:PTH1 family peptidyl-tRNA hydrolase
LQTCVEDEADVKLVAGLGNPGARYARTRHNVGFDAVDEIAASQRWPWDGQRSRAVLASGLICDEKVLLAKPQAFMNESGQAVADLVRFYKLELGDLLVICDDLDLAFGKVRLRERGAAGGQHGLEDIVCHLSSTDFARIKVGVGRPPAGRDANVGWLLSAPRRGLRHPRDEGV